MSDYPDLSEFYRAVKRKEAYGIQLAKDVQAKRITGEQAAMLYAEAAKAFDIEYKQLINKAYSA